MQLPDSVEVYTDGSNDGYQTGAGVFSAALDLELKLPLGRYAIVFQSEAYAIPAATNAIEFFPKASRYFFGVAPNLVQTDLLVFPITR